MSEVICFSCQSENKVVDRLGFRDSCISCFNDLHVCKTCHFYDPKSYNDCSEPAADRVSEKEKRNFCEFYQIKSHGLGAEKNPTRDVLRAQAEALFNNQNKKNKT